VRWIDPTGLNAANPYMQEVQDGRAVGGVWLIHGTFSSPDTWTESFRDWIVSASGPFTGWHLDFGDWSNTGGFLNSGAGNSIEARIAGATVIFNEILMFHRANPNAPISLVGHSHGGNVAILVINMLAEYGINVDTLITIGTPARTDFQLGDGVTVGQHINIYARVDRMQTLGAEGGVMYHANTSHISTAPISGGRLFSSPAINIEATSAPNRVFRSHSYMHSNQAIWRQYIMPILR